MLRLSFITLSFLAIIILPSFGSANEHAVLEEISAANQQAQPGLDNYHVRVKTSRIAAMMARLTKGIPDNVAPPPAPVIYKFWQRNGQGLIYAESQGLTPYVENMVKKVSGNLAIELNEMILPPDKSKLRQSLINHATVKKNEVALANSSIIQLQIDFNQPTDLNEAFYVTGMRLPQKQVTSLAFDIDPSMQTVNELKVTKADGLQLLVEIRYHEVKDGYIPERFKITSPDGKIDDQFTVELVEIDGYSMPKTMLRTIRRPELTDNLQVSFEDYRINQSVSADILNKLQTQ